MTQETQESRRDTVSAAVTSREKWHLQLVAKKEGKPLSDLVREYPLTELIERGRRIDEAIDALGPDTEKVA